MVLKREFAFEKMYYFIELLEQVKGVKSHG